MEGQSRTNTNSASQVSKELLSGKSCYLNQRLLMLNVATRPSRTQTETDGILKNPAPPSACKGEANHGS